MNSVIWFVAAACLAGMQAAPSLPPLPVNPGGIGGLFRGPNSETIIRGPDGSQITSEQIGGAIQTDTRLEPIIVPDEIGDQGALPSDFTAPLTSAGVISIETGIPLPSPTPVILQSDITINSHQPTGLQGAIPLASPSPVAVPIPIATVQEVPIVATSGEPHIIETELVDAPDIEPEQSSDLKGPSGTISVRGSSSIVSGPASTTISEPVRKVAIASVPIQHVAIQPQPLPIETVAPATYLVPPAPIPIVLQQSTTSNTDLITNLGASSIPRAQTPLISLGGTSGAGIADAALRYDLTSPQVPTVSSTQAPQLFLTPQNGIDLGYPIITSTQGPALKSLADIDVSRINLGQSTIQKVPIQSRVSGIAVTSPLTPLREQNIISSTETPISVSSPASVTSRQSLNVPTPTELFSPNLILQSNGLSGNVNLQDQAIVTNQIISSTPGYTAIDSRDIISPTQTPSDIRTSLINTQSRPWINVDPRPQTTVSSPAVDSRSQGQNLGSIASVLDTVLVQPTDPRNREVIEVGGKQLENVGNIVPVVRNPVLFAGDFGSIQQIPTASISQLSTRNDLDPNIYNRYGRDTKNKNA